MSSLVNFLAAIPLNEYNKEAALAILDPALQYSYFRTEFSNSSAGSDVKDREITVLNY